MDKLLTEVVKANARARPDAAAITWLADGERPGLELSYGQLQRRAERRAAQLRAMLRPGERALLLGEHAASFIEAFLGCLDAGIIAVPAALPRANQSPQTLTAICEDCRPAACVTCGIAPRAGDRLRQIPALQGLQWIDADVSPEAIETDRPVAPIDPEGVAYLQYTSGTTARPRGVMISHANLLANQHMMAEVAGHDSNTRYVGWLPLFHDMGLCGIALQSLFLGGHCVLMPPRYFLQKPMRWLSAIARYRATSSAAPDFAYALSARSMSDANANSLDLSCWRAAISGGEMIRPQTLDHFARKFAPSGFKPTSWLPCYGLAEATCLVTGPRHGQPPTIRRFDAEALKAGLARPAEEPGRDRELVGCGRARLGEQVAIVDPNRSTPAAAGCVGEIWIHGPAVGLGYWRSANPEESDFAGRLSGDTRPWLRTGDLGFVFEGELFICGRLKDVIIVRGSNHSAEAIEQTMAQANASFAGGRSAAFAVELKAEPRLILLQEPGRADRVGMDRAGAIGDLRAAVLAEHGLAAHAIVLVRFGSLPITSSGKIQRQECRRRLATGELHFIAGDFGNPDCRLAEA